MQREPEPPRIVTIQKLKQRAQSGDKRAQCVLGRRYELGIQVPKNLHQALRWYRKAAEQGFRQAVDFLAEKHLSDFHSDDCEENMREALRWLRALAGLGVVVAQRELAKAVMESDLHDSAHWCQLAAKGGDAQAQFMLAEYYSRGNGVPENQAEAFRWYLSAERLLTAPEESKTFLNDPFWLYWKRDLSPLSLSNLSFNVGTRYATGWGTQKNADEALKRLLPLANPRTTSDPFCMQQAQLCVGWLMADPGHGICDLVEAYAWLNLAAAYAPSSSLERSVGFSREQISAIRDPVLQEMDPQQVQRAEQRSAELFVPNGIINERVYQI